MISATGCLKCNECSVAMSSSIYHLPICDKCNEARATDLSEHFNCGTSLNSGRFTYKLEGAFADGSRRTTVHLAKLTGTTEDLRIAVKIVVLSGDRTTAEQQKKMLGIMVKRWADLSHVNLVRHYDPEAVYQDRNDVHRDRFLDYSDYMYFHIPMEYCSGGTLRFAAQYFVCSKTVLNWTKQIANGLSYLHSSGVVHRDLKGTNVFLSSSDYQNCVMKIGDLGEMKQLLDVVTRRGEVASYRGTVGFMSPEMIKGANGPFEIGRKTDIWSFGCVIIEMMTGCLEFVQKAANGTSQVLQGSAVQFYVAKGGKPQIPQYIPEQLAQLIASCFHHRPVLRPSATKLYDALELLEDMPQWTDMRPAPNSHFPTAAESCPLQ